MKYIITIFLFLTLLGCNNNDQKATVQQAENGEDSSGIMDDDDRIKENTVAFINGTGFSKYAKSAMPQLDWTKFEVTRFWKEEFNTKSTFSPEKDFFEIYGPFLKYSPDSSKFLDLDSYNLSIYKANNGKLVADGQGPDTEVSMVIPATKQRIRLIFLGPGNSVEDAAWIDNENFVLFGLQENEAATATNAVIWRFNLAEKMVYLYELPDSKVVDQWKNYSETQRLKNVTIR